MNEQLKIRVPGIKILAFGAETFTGVRCERGIRSDKCPRMRRKRAVTVNVIFTTVIGKCTALRVVVRLRSHKIVHERNFDGVRFQIN